MTDALHNTSRIYHGDKGAEDEAYGAQRLVDALQNARNGDYRDALSLVYDLMAIVPIR